MAFRDALVPLSNLHFDPENPRHHPIRDEGIIISTLVSTEQVIPLMKDIAEQNGTSPIERLAVVPHNETPGHYITVEGNRRLCALKFLNDPNLAPNTATRKQAKSALSLMDGPLTEVAVCIFDTLDEAQPWITRRHMGAQGGVGTRTWTPEGQQRNFQRQDLISGTEAAQQNALAYAILDRLSQLGALSQTTRNLVPVTTLSRYLGTPTVRDALGLNGNSELIYAYADSEVDSALNIFVLDSLPHENQQEPRLSSRSDARQRRAYALEFAERGHCPRTPKSPPSRPAPPEPTTTSATEGEIERQAEDHSTPPDAAPAPSTEGSQTPPAPNPAPQPTQGGNVQSTRRRETEKFMMPNGFTVRSSDPVIRRLANEMKTLDVSAHEFAANYLLRSFLERTMFVFLRSHNKPHSGLSDSALTMRAKELCQALSAPRDVMDVLGRAASNQHCSYSLPALGGAIHGAHIPTKRDLFAHFDTWKASLQFMLSKTNS